MHKLAGDFVLTASTFMLLLILKAEEIFHYRTFFSSLTFLVSLSSPLGGLYSFYMNFNICDNIYKILYNYKNTFKKRYLWYKYSAKVLVFVFFAFSLAFNRGISTEKGSVKFYSPFFIAVFYCVCSLLALVTLVRLVQVFIQRAKTYRIIGTALLENSEANKVVSSFLSHQIAYVVIFLCTYTPTCLAQLASIFDFPLSLNWNLTVYLVISSLILSLLVKLTEPYMVEKYIKRNEVESEEVTVFA